jgi:cytidylate kinase
MKKQIITIAGKPGSGKSSTAKAVAKTLGFRHFSSGDLFRQLGKERGVDVLEANKAAGVVEDLDKLVDGKLQDMGKTEDEMVLDSRTAWHWMPDSFKVFLDLDMETAAVRILKEDSEHRQTSEEIPEDPKHYAKSLADRMEIERKRYAAIYDIDPYDTSNYDLVIDTSDLTLEEVAAKVLEAYENWQKQ